MADPARKSHLAAYALVALVSLGAGAAGAVLAVRYLPGWQREAAAVATSGADSGSEPMAGMEASAAGDGPSGTAGNGVYISPARQQLIGVRTALVTRRALDTTIRATGTIAYDETRVTQVHTKVTGWIDTVSVDYVGKAVRRGEPLFTIYSPELVATQNEYLLALRAQRQLGDSRFAETRTGADALVSAARDRLRLWDISEAQIEELERTGQPRKTLTLYSPFDGVVLERNAFAGQYISPEMSTFKIADLSTIWVLAHVFEYETRTVKVGQDAEIQFPYGQSTRALKGKITFIYPEVDPMTRRVKVRIAFPNAGFELKPETYVTVVIRARMGAQLAIPREAVLDNGDRRYAIVARPQGYFEPREIEVGQPVDDFFPLLKGLADGEQVVTSAQFLIDSETNLQAAMQAMSMSMPGMDMGSQPSAGEHSGHGRD
jgi:RND family efflux transporter MFP subunit